MKMGKPTMVPEMLIPLLTMFLGFTLLFACLMLIRLRAELLRRERSQTWIKEALDAKTAVPA
jgi:heme exporter protein C